MQVFNNEGVILINTEIMKCKTIHKNLIFFLEKELPDSELNRMQQHIDACPDCALFAEEMRLTLGILETERVTDENPFFYTRVKAKLENEANTQNALVRRPILSRVLQPVAFSFLLLLGVYGGIKMGNVSSSPQTNNIVAEQDIIPYWSEMDGEPIENFLIQ